MITLRIFTALGLCWFLSSEAFAAPRLLVLFKERKTCVEATRVLRELPVEVRCVPKDPPVRAYDLELLDERKGLGTLEALRRHAEVEAAHSPEETQVPRPGRR